MVLLQRIKQAALAAIKVAVANAGYELGKDITLALDCAHLSSTTKKRISTTLKAKVKNSLLKNSTTSLKALLSNTQLFQLKTA